MVENVDHLSVSLTLYAERGSRAGVINLEWVVDSLEPPKDLC